MRSLPVKILGAVLVGLVALTAWLFLAPEKLGGSTTYSVTSGISMQPLLHKNDLAFVRAQSSYHVGEVVLYQSPVVHRPVLHRIILIQNGNYFFKGDNNNFVDPGYATRSELTGTLWFSVPAVGGWLAWFGKPAHAALLAGLAVALIALATMTTTKRRRRRRRGSSKMTTHRPPSPPDPAPAPSPALSPAPSPSAGGDPPSNEVAGRRPPPYLDGPMSTLIVLGVVLSLAVLCLFAGFTRPTTRVGAFPNASQQAGVFAYSATVKAPSAVYPSGTVSTGEPIYPSLVDTVTVHFGYQFASKLPHDVKGTIQLRALVLSKTDTWQEVSTVVPVTKFTGDNASVSNDVSLTSLYALIDSVSSQSGVTGTNYSLDLQPVVHLTGTVDGHRITETFSPVLPFAVTQGAIRVDVAVAPPPPGATYVPSTATAALDAALHPSQAGSIPRTVTNDLSVARYKIPVPVVRSLGVAFALAALVVAFVHDRRRRRGVRYSEEEHTARRLGVLIVPVAAFGSTAGQTPIAVPDFTRLAELARFLERPILFEVRKGRRTYAVDDDARRYLTQAADRRERGGRDPAGPEPDTTTKPPAATDDHREAPATTGHRDGRTAHAARTTGAHTKTTFAIRAGAALGAMAVIATLSVSLTASNNVPTSNIGRSAQARQIAQLTPAGCAGLSLTTMVQKSGTFSNSASHVLLIGSKNADRITDIGQYNCIVGGGGTDTVTASLSDVCIIGPTSGAIYLLCNQKAS